MGKMRKGRCRLCGEHKDLSFEHIPPKKAYNNTSIQMRSILGPAVRKFRRGLGDHSLCVECNNLTGAWYGEAFVEWSRQAFEVYERLKGSGESAIAETYNIRPLNVIKQTIVMALAMAPEASIDLSFELRHFVLNRKRKFLPTTDKVYVYYNVEGRPRFNSGMAVLNINNGSGSFIRAEVALPPFGYVISNALPGKRDIAVAQDLCSITSFAEHDYDSYAQVELLIPARETHFPFPTDYRTQAEIHEQRDIED